jgi:tetratricopeptide (TPR) repeat protein
MVITAALPVTASSRPLFADHQPQSSGTPPNAAEDALNRRFQAAVAEYEAAHFPEAAAALEALLPQAPDSFEIHELLGLTYAQLSQDAKSAQHLEAAARLNPKSASAHSNLAVSRVHAGKLASAESEFKRALELEPQNYDVNHNLGELYIRAGKIEAAVPYLERAQRLQPVAEDNGYDLALAYLTLNRRADARRALRSLLKAKNSPELHNLLGEVEEKDGNFVVAANEYETAAHLDPSEGNLFDWGSELLLHRTLDAAVEVFKSASERYAGSARISIGLGIAYYSRGNYDDAVKSLLHAADLSPSDPRVYFFLSRAYDSSPGQASEVIEHFRRFAELQPGNGRAQFYYAMSLWKGKRAQDPALDLVQIEKLLKVSLRLDSSLAEAHLQLGNLYSDQSKYLEAIPEYLQALALNSDLADAHYRLGQAYIRTGDKERGQEQLQTYQKLRDQHLADLDRQRAEIRQFVYASKDSAPPSGDSAPSNPKP